MSSYPSSGASRRHAELEAAMLDKIRELAADDMDPHWRNLIGWQNPDRDEWTYRRLVNRGAIVESGDDENPRVTIAGEAVAP